MKLNLLKFQTGEFLSAFRNIGVIVVSSGFLDIIFVTTSLRSPGAVASVFGLVLIYGSSFRRTKTPKEK